MPALPPVPGVMKAVQAYDVGTASLAICGHHIEWSGTDPTLTQLATFQAAYDAAWPTHMAPAFGNDTIFTGSELTVLTSPTSPQVNTIGGLSDAGSRSGTKLSSSDSAIVQRHVARRYRGGHSRMYFPAGVEGDIAAGRIWSSAFQTAMLSAWEDFSTAIFAAGWTGAGTLQGCSISYFEGFTNVLFPSGRYRAVPTRRVTPLVDAISHDAVNPRLGEQRRRNRQSS